MKSSSVLSFHRVTVTVVCLGALVLAVFLVPPRWFVQLNRHGRSPGHFSGPLADGNNAFGLHGRYQRTIDFSPDGKIVAYVWSDVDFASPKGFGGRPFTLAESVSLRVRHLGSKAPELNIPLESVDLRPKGIMYFGLGVAVQASPDSQHVMGIVARRIVLVDVLSGKHRALEYSGEFFGSAAWLNPSEIAFSTTDAKALTFWRYNINSPAAERKSIHREPLQAQAEEGPPTNLSQDQWSPNGRFVAFTSYRQGQQGEEVLLDFDTHAVHPFPFSLYYQCWKPDSSALLVNGRTENHDAMYLIDPATGKTEDLTEQFHKGVATNTGITLVSPLWTPDGKYVLLYTNEGSTARHRGMVVRPVPFEVVLSRGQILRWSPLTNWFLAQGEMTFKWLDISGQKTAAIRGWVNDWRWSRDGALAARIEYGRLVVFRPKPPPGVEPDPSSSFQ